MTARVVITGASVLTMDPDRAEHPDGYVVLDGPRIAAVGAGAPDLTDPELTGAQVVDGRGCLLTPGLVNIHHHLYQWATRGMAVDATLFGWLTTLYPVWSGLDEQAVYDAARGALGWLALTGCTTSTDHHYVFPRAGGDLLAAEVAGAASVGLRFHPTRGSMDLGVSAGGLPPDEVVEDVDTVLAATADAIDRFHDPEPGAMVRVGVAPCSPFTGSPSLFAATAQLARQRGVRLHTHLAETLDEAQWCQDRYGHGPVDHLDSLDWLGPDVWVAHAVHLSDHDIARLATTGTAVAHCPSSNARLGAGIAPVAALRRAGVSVGLGVDGAASNEAASLVEELRHALLFARAVGGPTALGVREAVEMATLGGAAALGRADEIGSLEPGKLADLALWRLDGLGHADIADPVAALVLGPPPPLARLWVHGRPVVADGHLLTADEGDLARAVTRAHRRLTDEGAHR